MATKKIAVAYIPVLHKGYINFLEKAKTSGVVELYLIGDDILQKHAELDYINRKDRIRAVDVVEMVQALRPLTEMSVFILDEGTAAALVVGEVNVVTPSEDIGKVVVEKYFQKCEVEYIDIFLRINRETVGEQKAVEAQKTIPASEFQKKLFKDRSEERCRERV